MRATQICHYYEYRWYISEVMMILKNAIYRIFPTHYLTLKHYACLKRNNSSKQFKTSYIVKIIKNNMYKAVFNYILSSLLHKFHPKKSNCIPNADQLL